ncbi:MutS-related protein [Deminuibacter soli]|uniref:DNA mismatch repair proteins mutS family domain-containing protein n=1 Tax=Deminuibacter soli TaxID=2291815 RepID=A0A3E1NJ48_9BACT|nr:hypothetical protein [Deminuibacter soli]RFM27955.1 hypothetical protein DXN05_10435 [Deminuibacter soli]
MNPNYWLLATICCPVLVLLIVKRNEAKRRRLLRQLRKQWGKPVENTRDFAWIGYYSSLVNAPGRVSNQLINDLDLHELFHYLDRTQSKPGQQYLYHRLLHPVADLQELQAFDDLCEHFLHVVQNREKAQLLLTTLSSHEAYYISTLLEANGFAEPAWAKWLPVNQCLVIVLLLASLQYPFLLIWSIIPFTINMLLHLWTRFKAGRYIHAINQLNTLITVTDELGKAGIPMQHWPISQELQALQRFRKKSAWLHRGTVNSDLNTVLFLAIDAVKALFLIETSTFISCMRFIRNNRQSISCLMAWTGRADAALSFASLKTGHHDWCKPFLVPGEKRMIAYDMYHPLINGCVRNSIEINGKGLLVTGSNMSGKTTFIRTLAINTLLAQTFYTCFARYFQLPFVQVHSSIRVSDDLLSGKSYFLEEVHLIGEFIAAAGNGEQHLFVLDEVFKGTNTAERIAAGKAILSRLNNSNSMVVVSTHDTELARLLKEEYNLYHFEEIIRDNQLVFDHVLKTGPLTRSNAIRLLQLNGYPESVVQEAQQITDKLKTDLIRANSLSGITP